MMVSIIRSEVFGNGFIFTENGNLLIGSPSAFIRESILQISFFKLAGLHGTTGKQSKVQPTQVYSASGSDQLTFTIVLLYIVPPDQRWQV